MGTCLAHMIKKGLSVGCALILFSFFSNSNVKAEFFGDVKVGFHPITSDRYGAALFVPNQFTQEHDWPLVVVLYSDESEKGNLFNEKWLSEFRARQEIVLFISFLRPRETPASSDERVKHLIEKIKAMYPIDETRVLLTGYGEAAHYAFYLAYQYPDLFSSVGLAAGGAQGTYEVFFNRDTDQAKALHFLVLYGNQDATIQRDSFVGVHQALKTRGFQIEMEEFDGLDHQFHPQFATRILDWFEAIPAKAPILGNRVIHQSNSSVSNLPFGLPRYIVALVRGLVDN